MGKSSSRRERPTPKLKKESVRVLDVTDLAEVAGGAGVGKREPLNRSPSRYCLGVD